MATAKKLAFRSKYERRVYESAKRRGIALDYEPRKFLHGVPVSGGVCLACGASKAEIVKRTTYTPDFRLANGTFVESKGKFTSAMRTKLVSFIKDHPTVKLRILFQRDNWITKAHAAKYSDWAYANSIEYAVGEEIPKSWSTT